MQDSRYFRVLILIALLVGACIGTTSVSAHEHRPVGKYEFVVGFLNEPAFEGELNAMSVRITNAATKQPVENLEHTLKAQLIFGPEQRSMELKPVWNDPGHYKAHFYPTSSGAYTFRFFGDIEGIQVDEQFTSKPGGFNEVQAPAELQFPVTVPANTQLNTQLAAAQNAVRTATLLGTSGLILGLVSLAVALIALRRRSAARGLGGASAVPSSR